MLTQEVPEVAQILSSRARLHLGRPRDARVAKTCGSAIVPPRALLVHPQPVTQTGPSQVSVACATQPELLSRTASPILRAVSASPTLNCSPRDVNRNAARWRPALRHPFPQCSFWLLIRKKRKNLAINTQSWILRFSAELGWEHLITSLL